MINKLQMVNCKSLKNQNSGQIVLILVLITVVGLTIGLSLISRTITDVRISSQIEQSSRAFSAAEAGIESALKGAAVGPTGSVNLPGANAKYNVTTVGGSSNVYAFPLTEINTTQTVWLVDRNSDGSFNESEYFSPNSTIEICWGTDLNNPAALIFTLYYKLASDYKVAKSAYDPNDSRRLNENFFSAPDKAGNYCDGNYQFKKTMTATSIFGVNPSSILLALRVTPLYANTVIAVKAIDDILPIQGKRITSVGKTDTGIVRKIQVNQGFDVLPNLLDFTLFTEN